MEISNNTVVTIHYTLKNNNGDIIDSSSDAGPFSYLHGANNIIPGLESALTGKTVGEKLDTTIEPKDAYGERHDDLIQVLPRAQFAGVDDLQPGMQFQAESTEGNMQIITVTAVNDEEVTVDANHPLAGETLHFSVEILDLREATESEIEHGHTHHDGDDH